MVDRIPDNFLIEGELTSEQERIFIEQINRFNELNNVNVDKGNPLVNDNLEVFFSEGTLIHGTSRYDETMLRNISQTGILTGQALGKSEDGETYYCADFHRVVRDVTIEQYNSEFGYNDGRCPFGRRTDNSMAVAFVIVPNDINRELLSYDCYREGTLEADITKSFINYMPLSDRQKASSILYGVPVSCINGIVVGIKIANDKEKINFLITLFPNSYIVTTFGELIYNPSRGEKLGDEIIDIRLEKISLEYERRLNQKRIGEQNHDIINLINKNILLIDLIRKNCDVNLFDNLDILSLLKMVVEVLFPENLEINGLACSKLLEMVKDYLSKTVEYKPYVLDSTNNLLIQNGISSLRHENVVDSDKIKKCESLIDTLNQFYNTLWTQMFMNCKDEEIVNVLVSLGWQGKIDENYVINMRNTMRKGFGK